ncbi:MAG: hypothetical protein ACI9W4_000207 [Rhodothermales bacterium]|jgi:hypothetical protein
MKVLLLVASMGLCFPVMAQTDSQQVEQVARDVLAAVSAKDSTAFMNLMMPGARAYSVFEQAVRFGNVEVEASGLAQGGAQPPFLERMWDPTVMVTNDLAVVWTPYDFWIGDQFSHCGTDVLTILRTAKGWRVAAIAYNIVNDCEPSPLGPPTF